jgi:quercetin dioxygenase-like cupin family protein
MSNINVKHHLSEVNEYFSPKVIGEVNDAYIKVAKIKGEEIPWHNHENEDELFYIVEGTLLLEIENQENIMMNKGDLYVVKKGANHRVSSVEECHIMLMENKTTQHTGKVQTEITRSIEEQL